MVNDLMRDDFLEQFGDPCVPDRGLYWMMT